MTPEQHKWYWKGFNDAKAQPEQEPNKDGSPCPEFWDWLPKAYNFDGNGAFTKYNMEVAFLAGKQAAQPEQEPTCKQSLQVEQEPIGKIVDCDFVGNSIARFERHLPFGTLLYTSPPAQRPSRSDIKPLTNQAIKLHIFEHTKLNPNLRDDQELIGYIVKAARAIEAAHGIKEEA